MSEVKKKRGRPIKYKTNKERVAAMRAAKRKAALKFKNVTASKDAAQILWDCVVVMSAKIGVKLTISQVIILLLNEWLAENDPTGELRKDERYIEERKRRTT